ncbi:MAG: glycosyltransferase family 2 protein [Planctomycetota bacterium]|jgi:glycosyltransferase involved in cell wall biosynthesis
MISVITPAHNEELLIEKCLCSVKAAANKVLETIEHIVVLNRCTDQTGEIAIKLGAKVITDDSRNLSHIRNKGVAVSKGDILVTIDADSQMTSNMLLEVSCKLKSGKYIGGGVRIVPERISFGILCNLLVVVPFVLWHGVSAGMFWCLRKDYEAIEDFNEKLACLEDVDFGKRLKKYGKKFGKRYCTIRKAHIVSSCRKFDQFGDWYFIKNPMIVYRIFNRDQKQADQFYYDARSEITEQDTSVDG